MELASNKRFFGKLLKNPMNIQFQCLLSIQNSQDFWIFPSVTFHMLYFNRTCTHPFRENALQFTCTYKIIQNTQSMLKLWWTNHIHIHWIVVNSHPEQSPAYINNGHANMLEYPPIDRKLWIRNAHGQRQGALTSFVTRWIFWHCSINHSTILCTLHLLRPNFYQSIFSNRETWHWKYKLVKVSWNLNKKEKMK